MHRRIRFHGIIAAVGLAALAAAPIPAAACNDSQCPLTAATHDTGPVPQPIGAEPAPAASPAAAPAAANPMRLDRFRRTASRKSGTAARNRVQAEARQTGARREAPKREARAPRPAGTETTEAFKTPPMPEPRPAPVIAETPAAPLSAAEAFAMATGGEVKIVDPAELNAIDRAARPATDGRAVAATDGRGTASPAPTTLASADSRPVSLDSLNRTLTDKSTVAETDRNSDDGTWMTRMMLILGGAFAAAAAAARFLLMA